MGSRACEGKILKCRLLFDDVEFARAGSTGTQNRIRILWAPVGSSKVLQAAGCELQAARLHPRLKDIQHHLVGVVGRATSRETPGEVDMETFPDPGEPEPYLIHLPGGLPGGSPADHPDEVVLDTFPLRNACKFIWFWKNKGALDLRTRIGRPPLQENSGKSYWGLEIR